MKLQIVAVADGPPKQDYLIRGYNAFLDSSRRYGFEPVILGWGQPWTGLGSKPKLLKQAIDGGKVDADYIIFADAFDVWFAEDPNTILEASMDKTYWPNRIIWNAEKDCFPDINLADQFPETESPFKYLNSGLSIGDTSAYLECLTEMEVDKWVPDFQKSDGHWQHKNDQLDWQLRFLHGQCPGQVPMCLDSECNFFQTLTGVSEGELRISGDAIFNESTHTWPMAFHANGPAKTAGLMEPILKHLGL